MSADPLEIQARRHRARQMVVGALIVVGLIAVVGVTGNREADQRAARQRDKLARALAHVSYRDAVAAPFNGVLDQVRAETGGDGVNWEGATGTVFSEQVVGWWFWAPRCVVGVVTAAGATVTVSSGSQCPPVPSVLR